jgi:hypothetical protein
MPNAPVRAAATGLPEARPPDPFLAAAERYRATLPELTEAEQLVARIEQDLAAQHAQRPAVTVTILDETIRLTSRKAVTGVFRRLRAHAKGDAQAKLAAREARLLEDLASEQLRVAEIRDRLSTSAAWRRRLDARSLTSTRLHEALAVAPTTREGLRAFVELAAAQPAFSLPPHAMAALQRAAIALLPEIDCHTKETSHAE